jgi:CRP/FNR family transcriptional regulator, anaerobic regulatory protein
VMMSYVLLADGSRQILRFLFPGDLIGVPGVVYDEPPETLAAITDCIVCPFDQAALGTLFVDHPRLAALILVLSQMERAGLADRLAGLGRTGAKARVAALLLDWWHRLRASDPSVEASFPLLVTQEEVGDATGLTAVHVNRMLRELENEKLIARDNGRVTIVDERGMIRAANYVNRSEGLALSWLPKGR